MFHLPSFSLSLEWNLFLLLLHLSIIIPLEIVKVLLWEELKSGIPLKALIFFMFFMEANADLFFQSEINCYCNWFVLSCTDRCQGREESVRSGVWSWQPLCCESAQLLGNVFTHVLECLHSCLTVVLDALPCQGTSVRTALQLSPLQLFSPGYHLSFSATSVGKAAAKPAGGWHGALVLWLVLRKLLLWHCDVTNEFLQYCCSNSRCYLLPGLLTLIAKNLSPAMTKLAEENLCSHFSCFSANSASLCKSGSRI